MKQNLIFDDLIMRYPQLVCVRNAVMAAYETIVNCFDSGGKLLVCGNGGSAGDSDHIVGELMKGFNMKRPLPGDLKEKLGGSDEGKWLADNLQSTLPAISLPAHTALTTAIGNDISFDAVYAQQVLGYGLPGDVLIGISTSGNSKNVVMAGIMAKALGMTNIGLTGAEQGRMDECFDILIKAPATKTSHVQDLHIPIYHTLCAMIEAHYWVK